MFHKFSLPSLSLSVYSTWYLEPFFRIPSSFTRSSVLCSWLPLLPIQFLNHFITLWLKNSMIPTIFTGVNMLNQLSSHTDCNVSWLIRLFLLIISQKMIVLRIVSTLIMKPGSPRSNTPSMATVNSF